jgi:hypothetical protein
MPGDEGRPPALTAAKVAGLVLTLAGVALLSFVGG